MKVSFVLLEVRILCT